MEVVRIREAELNDRFALARTMIDATFSAFHGRVPDQCLKWIGVEESAHNWGKSLESMPPQEQLLVAEVAERDVVGLILAGRPTIELVHDEEVSSRYPIEITSLQVSPAWQGKGIGRKLIGTAAEKMLSDGESSLMVRVLRDNPNIAFYERLGAERLCSQPYRWEAYDTYEEILGWKDMGRLT